MVKPPEQQIPFGNLLLINFGVPGTEHIKGTIDLVAGVKALTTRTS